MFDYNYPDLKLTWVARSLKYSQTGWIEYDKLKRLEGRIRNAKSK